MTENDKEFLKEFVRGVTFTIGVVGIFIIGIAMLSGGEDAAIDKRSVEVVDTYKGCDIVRWYSPQLAEYKYFLHCEKSND